MAEKMKPITSMHGHYQFVDDLYRALGLDPKLVRSFKLIIEPESIVVCEVELFVEEGGLRQLGTVVKEYALGLHEMQPKVEHRKFDVGPPIPNPWDSRTNEG